MTTKSYWLDSMPGETYPALERDIEVDVAVVGAGITGVTAALLLARAGKSVALLEARRVGEIDTGHTTAHLTELLDTRYHQLIDDFGREGAGLAARAQRGALDRIGSLVASERLDCDYHAVAAYLYAESGGAGEIEKEYEACAGLGLAVSLTNETGLPFAVARALRVDGQARFHVMKYLRPLAAAVARETGGRLFERSRVVSFEDGEPCRVRLENDVTITARDVIVASYTPVSNRVTLHTKIAPYRTYALALRVPGAPDGLYWDTADPYHYTRTQPSAEGALLIVGGEDHKTGTEHDTLAHFHSLETYAVEHFGRHPIVARWSGQIFETVDGLPYIGKNPHDGHTYVATGYSGNGMTWGTAAATLLTDLVLGVANPAAELLSPSRIKPLAAAKDFVRENVSVAAHFVGDLVKPAEASSVDEVGRGEGKIVRIGGHKLAVYRDESGGVTACSAVCPHLGCVVQWNNAEQTWDCPCHGSRFEPGGAVINGPSVAPLERKTV